MAKSKKIEKIASIEKLEYIRENVTNSLTESRVKACVFSLKKEANVNYLLRILSEMNIRFAEESDTFKEEAPDYNKKYATNINGKFTLAYNTLSLIKEEVFFLYKMMNHTSCNSQKTAKSPYIDNKSIEYKVTHTMLGNMPYTGDLFDPSTETQKRLIQEIKSFINYLDSNLEMCINIVREEELIGNNVAETYSRFEKQINELFEYIEDHKGKARDCDADYYQDLLLAYDDPSVTKKWWHKLKHTHLLNLAYGLKDKRLSCFTPLERKTFKENPDKLTRFRKVVSHLDDVFDKITGQTLVYIQQYTECESSQSGFHKCFTETYQQNGGQLNIVTYPRFNQACTKAYHVDQTEGYLDFLTKMDKYLQ